MAAMDEPFLAAFEDIINAMNQRQAREFKLLLDLYRDDRMPADRIIQFLKRIGVSGGAAAAAAYSGVRQCGPQ